MRSFLKAEFRIVGMNFKLYCLPDISVLIGGVFPLVLSYRPLRWTVPLTASASSPRPPHNFGSAGTATEAKGKG